MLYSKIAGGKKYKQDCLKGEKRLELATCLVVCDRDSETAIETKLSSTERSCSGLKQNQTSMNDLDVPNGIACL